MNRRDIGTDDPRVRVRPGKGSRQRTKNRPSHTDAVPAFVTEVDRGRFTAVTKVERPFKLSKRVPWGAKESSWGTESARKGM